MTHTCELCGHRINYANAGHSPGCGNISPAPLPPVTELPPDTLNKRVLDPPKPGK